MPKSREEYIISCLQEEMNDFNDWEQNFIESIASQLEKGKILSDKQIEILERLWSK